MRSDPHRPASVHTLRKQASSLSYRLHSTQIYRLKDVITEVSTGSISEAVYYSPWWFACSEASEARTLKLHQVR